MLTNSIQFGDTTSRRLSIYLMIACSEATFGEPLDAVDQYNNQLVADLRNDSMAVEATWLSLITFAGKVPQITSLQSY